MDLLQMAINMEREGEQYYKKLAESSKGNHLKNVFDGLAEDEKHHAELLEDKCSGKTFEANLEDTTASRSVFKEEDFFEYGIITTAPSQLDVYKLALQKEKESIDLYKKLMGGSAENRELFEFLIRQETKHFEVLDELVKLLNRPNDWAEAPEFGRREEY